MAFIGVVMSRRVLVVLVLVVAAVSSGCVEESLFPDSSSGESSTLTDDAIEELIEELDRVGLSVSIPPEWEVEFTSLDSVIRNAAPGGVAYQSSSDLSSSGTWMMLSVTPTALLPDGTSSEERFWREIEEIGSWQNEFAQEPIAINVGGLDGYTYELSGGKGSKTGRELGGFFAILFGSKYTYQVVIQFYLEDREEMTALFRGTLDDLATVLDGQEI